MSDQDLSGILGRCLERIAAGETVSACLADYPTHAAEIAPLLAMAGELETLGSYRLSKAVRQRTRTRLRQAEAARRARHSAWWWPGSLLAPRTVAGLAAALFCVILTAGMVAASQPGDLAYGVRVVVERAPALLAGGAAGRARAELGIASRRLADLETHLATKGELVPVAAEALLAGDQAVAAMADELSPTERAQAASRMAAHAATLATLAQSARQSSVRETLRAASIRVETLAQHLMRGIAPDGAGSSVGPGPVETPTASAVPIQSPLATLTPTPLASGVPMVTLSPETMQPTRDHETPTTQPIAPGQRATTLAQTATVSATSAPATPTVSRGTPGSGLAGTPTPGWRATALSRTVTAPAPGATHMAEPGPTHEPGAGSNAPEPGPRQGGR